MPLWVKVAVRDGDRARDVLGRLARDPHARHARDRPRAAAGLLGARPPRASRSSPRRTSAFRSRRRRSSPAASPARASGARGGVVHWAVVRRMVIAWGLTLPGGRAHGRGRLRRLRSRRRRHRAERSSIGRGRDRDPRPGSSLLSRRDPVQRRRCRRAAVAARAPRRTGLRRRRPHDLRDVQRLRRPHALWKILAVALLASVLVPVAFSVGDRRSRRAASEAAAHRTPQCRRHRSWSPSAASSASAAIALGIWAMLQK